MEVEESKRGDGASWRDRKTSSLHIFKAIPWKRNESPWACLNNEEWRDWFGGSLEHGHQQIAYSNVVPREKCWPTNAFSRPMGYSFQNIYCKKPG